MKAWVKPTLVKEVIVKDYRLVGKFNAVVKHGSTSTTEKDIEADDA